MGARILTLPQRLPTPAGVQLIKRWEAWFAVPYLCPANWWTIGWGCTRGLDGRPVTPGHPPITEAQGMLLLWGEIMNATRAVNRLCPVELAPHQVDALVSFTFNLGSGNLQASTLRRCILREDHDAAAAEFHRWVFAGGRKLRGLVLRRGAEAQLYAGNVTLAMAA